MDVFILLMKRCQSNYTEPRHYESAADNAEIIGVFKDWSKAAGEKEKLEMMLPEFANDGYNEFGEYDPEENRYFYEIVQQTVK